MQIKCHRGNARVIFSYRNSARDSKIEKSYTSLDLKHCRASLAALRPEKKISFHFCGDILFAAYTLFALFIPIHQILSKFFWRLLSPFPKCTKLKHQSHHNRWLNFDRSRNKVKNQIRVFYKYLNFRWKSKQVHGTNFRPLHHNQHFGWEWKKFNFNQSR